MIDPAAGARSTGQSAEIQLNTRQNLGLIGRAVGVRVFVADTGAGGSVVLRLAGRDVVATSSLPLRKGEWYFARVERHAGRITLRIDAQVTRSMMAGEIARAAGLPSDALAEAVVRAFIRTELPLTPERLARAYRRVASLRKTHSRRAGALARLDAIAEKKGLKLTPDLLGAIAGVSGRGSDSGDDHAGHRDRRPRRRGREEGPAISGEDVRASFRLSAEANHPLHLFNHVMGEGDHWVVVPIEAHGTGMKASLRLLIPRAFAAGADRASAAVREAVLVVEAGDDRWLFGMQPAQGQLKTILLSGPRSDRHSELLRELEGRLAAIGARFDSTVPPVGEVDGFSQQISGDIMTSVDSSV